MLLVYENKTDGIAVEWKKTVHFPPHLHEAIEVVYVTDGNIELGERVVRVESVPEAVEYLQNTTGNVLIATGSKELKEYTRIAGCKERCYARVLSTQVSVEESIRLGFEGKHLIAMQGPFSKELNLAMLRALDARYFVTKESGKSGGFLEKVQAAEEAKAVLVVVGRPFEVGKILKETKKFLEIWAGLC